MWCVCVRVLTVISHNTHSGGAFSLIIQCIPGIYMTYFCEEAMFNYILYSEPRNLYEINYMPTVIGEKMLLKIYTPGLLDITKLSYRSNKKHDQVV